MTQHPATIHISTPCSQPWAAMTPTSDGRHCAACQKTVVDFTQQSDAEILAFFKQTSPTGTCGRFRREQVNRPLMAGLPSPIGRRWQVWLASLLVNALATQSCHTTTGEPAPTNQVAAQNITLDSVTVQVVPYPTPISGRVVDSYTEQPVAGVSVQLANTSFSTVTDAAGLFAFPEAATPVPATHAKPFSLHLRAYGYPACDFVLDTFLPPPNQPLLVVSASVPVPGYLMGDVEELREPTQ